MTAYANNNIYQGNRDRELQFEENSSKDSGSTDIEVELTDIEEAIATKRENVEKVQQRSRWTCCGVFTSLITVGAIVTLLYFVVILDGDVENIPAFQGIFDQDPFDAVRPEDASSWANTGNGLNLEVVNCLDRRWHKFFEAAMWDWENGYPDCLTLSNSTREPEFTCAAEKGRVKVCNGNYGESGWKGQAEIFIDSLTNTIISASARMNEFYMRGNNEDEMRYAMCHELGHSWGLHHTDESFTNRNLGNCMDYTNRHRDNLRPDRSNYEFLFALYGLVPGAEPYNPPTSAPTMAPTPAPNAAGPSLGVGWNNQGGSDNPWSGGSNGGNTWTPPSGNTGGGTWNPPGGNTGGGGTWNPPSGNKDKEKEKEDKKNKDKDKNKDRDLSEIDNEWLASAMERARAEPHYGEHEYEIQLENGILLRVHNLLA